MSALYKYNFILIALLCNICLSYDAQATHNRAGEITFEQIGPLTIVATITTYTKASSVKADRDSLLLFWGDGTTTSVKRDNGNGNGILLPNNTKYNIYVAQHTYASRGTYTLSMTDPNRNGGILNVNPPRSVDVPFHLATTFTFLNPQFDGFNNSPVLNQPPIDIACTGQLFTHIPNASDPDGDSLAYELIVPLQGEGNPVPNYSFPDQIAPGPDNTISLNPITGVFTWDTPQKAGEYNIAFYIKEYRNGKLISKLIRDMQIRVENCDNRPPDFQLPAELCVIAGETIEIPIEVTDPDIPEDNVKIQVFGGPVKRGNAFLTVDSSYRNQPLNTSFIWQTDCNDIADQYYSFVVKAVDNGLPPSAEGEQRGLATLKNLRIKVIGPPPEGEAVEIQQNQVKLSWDSPYTCQETENNYFRGFTIWRREGSNLMPIDSCNSDLESIGYQQIAFNVKNLSNNRYSYIDKGVSMGNTYCYRITAEFALTTATGNPYNIVESLPTDELCVILRRDLPSLKNVSVRETNTENGKVYLRWLRPAVEALDTIENPGPYAFSIERSKGLATSNFSTVPSSLTTFSSFKNLTDTTFLDTQLNTLNNAYTYRIAFFTEGDTTEPYGYSSPATSVFLKITSTDRLNILRWDYAVPWYNYQFNIYKLNEITDNYELIDSTTKRQYRDNDLINGIEYCYYVQSVGSYGIGTLDDTLYNNSQKNCGVPIDTMAPCPPRLIIDNICKSGNEFDYDRLVNEIKWRFNSQCTRAPDITYIKIYYAVDSTVEFTFVEKIEIDEAAFLHSPDTGLKGCYTITAVDSVGNESEFGNIVCTDNCPLYSLPNAFTPNGDGSNDNLVPISNRFIERIDLKIYNRWGNLVFETNNPDINWDGTTRSGEIVSPATYFYVCKVYEAGSNNSLLTRLSGYIEIIH